MKIEYLLEHLTDKSTFLYLERYVGTGSRSYSSFAHHSDAAAKYQPSSDTEQFDMPCLSIPKEKIVIYFDNPHQQLLDHYIRKDSVLFPVHPEIFEDRHTIRIEELKKYSCSYMTVAPTASTRTVMNLHPNLSHHFIKLHYPRRISRFIRRLRRSSIQNSIETSKDLDFFSIPKFGYFPETIGMTYGKDLQSWGFIVREFVPRPKPEKSSLYIPLFALYSQDMKNKDAPLLIQIIERHNADPKIFTLTHIMHPIIQIWCSALKQRGILFEMHGQNVLLELDANAFPSRVICRDLDIYVDPAIRAEHDLDMHFPESHQIHLEDREAIYSLKYDAFIGHHVFDYIADLLERFYGISAKSMQDSCKEVFHHHFPHAGLYFTKKTFYYADEIFPDNAYKLVETNHPPRWR